MANRLRLRSGQVQLVRVRVRAEDAIDAGDMVYLDDNKARPASSFPVRGNAVETRAAFAAVFLGIAHQPSAPGEAYDISVDISPMAVYEVDCDHGPYEIGDDLAPSLDDLGGLESQRVHRISPAENGVARAVEYRTRGDTLRVCLLSAFGAAAAFGKRLKG